MVGNIDGVGGMTGSDETMGSWDARKITPYS